MSLVRGYCSGTRQQTSQRFLSRASLQIEEYEYTIEHVKGKENPVADSSSRIHAIQKVETPEGTVVLDFLQHFTEWKKKSQND